MRVALIASIVLAAVIGASPVQARDKVFRTQLDGDTPREQLRTQVRRCGQPSACSRLVLQDGSRRRALTPFLQPRLSYGWTVRRTRLVDFTGDGIREIAYELVTVAGTGSSPTLFGISQWDGRNARRIFEFRNGREPEPGYAYVISVVTRVVTGASGFRRSRRARASTAKPTQHAVPARFGSRATAGTARASPRYREARASRRRSRTPSPLAHMAY
jgi:hypothetical protein